MAARLHAAPRRRRFARPLALAFAALGAALAVAMAVPPARSAILDFFRIGGVEIRRVETVPPLSPARAAPGVRTSLAEARNSVDFELVVPQGYQSVYLEAGIVTFVWQDRLLMELRGDEQLLKKVVDQRSTVQQLDVNGYPAVWVAGAPHGLFIPGGDSRLAGNVLIWVRNGVTFRLEGDLTRARAVRIATLLTSR